MRISITWDEQPDQHQRGGRDSDDNAEAPGTEGDKDTRGSNQLCFAIYNRIRQTIETILKLFQRRINVTSLLAHSRTTADHILGTHNQNACLKILISGVCYRECKRQDLENLRPQLARSIFEAM